MLLIALKFQNFSLKANNNNNRKKTESSKMNWRLAALCYVKDQTSKVFHDILQASSGAWPTSKALQNNQIFRQ